MTAEFINTLNEVNQLNFFFASMISAHSCVSVKAVENNERLLNAFLEVLPETELEDKEKWEDRIKEGLKILEQEKKQLARKEEARIAAGTKTE